MCSLGGLSAESAWPEQPTPTPYLPAELHAGRSSFRGTAQIGGVAEFPEGLFLVFARSIACIIRLDSAVIALVPGMYSYRVRVALELSTADSSAAVYEYHRYQVPSRDTSGSR